MHGVPTRHPRLGALLLGGVSATGFAPLSLWPVTLLSVSILLILLSNISNRGGARSAFLLGWCFGVGQFTVGLNWIAFAFTFQDKMPHSLGYGAVVLLSLYLAVYPGFATLAAHILYRRWNLPLTPVFAATWMLGEMARATIFTGFAWNPLGMVWLGTGVDQSARWIGTYGLGGLAILAAGAIAALFTGRVRSGLTVLAAFVLLALLGKGMTAPPAHTNIAITVVQPNIGQDEKYDADREQAHFATLAALTGPSSPRRPRLIFWPEAAIPAWLDMEPEWLARIADLAGPNDLLMTGGAKVYFRERNKGFYQDRTLVGANNSAWVVGPKAQLLGRYDKAHLVPYGEYLPMRALLEPLGLSRLVPGDADFWPGPGPRSLLLPGAKGRPPLKMGVQICYEIIFSGEVVHRANRPDFLYNPSNDAWFGAWGPPQHLAQARMRAIEEAMPVIRSTPTGISAVIDAQGRILASLPHHKAGAINTFLPMSAPPTPLSRLGNLLPLAFTLFLLALAVVRVRIRR